MANVDFQIGVDPRNLGAFAPQATPTWGTAIAKLGNAWAAAHHKKKQTEAATAAESAKAKRRSGWVAELSKGTTIPGLAAKDPSIIGDTQFREWWKGAQPKAPEAGFEDILDDQGRPIAQRGPQGRTFAHPLAPEPEGPAPQRRIIKGPDNLNYYEDTKERVLPNVAAPTPSPEAEGPPLKDQLAMVRQLSDDWQKTVRPMQTLLAQSDRMNIGLQMARGGDMLAGSQAILISFNKLLDPTSVVRESEYARSATGQSALETMRGFVDKLSKGGAGVTLKELESYKRFGEQVVQRALENKLPMER